jgi:hypothetical protein
MTETEFLQIAAMWGVTAAPAGLAMALQRASDEVWERTGRVWLPSPASAGETETRYFWGSGSDFIYIDDALSVTAAACDWATVSSFVTEPRSGSPAVGLRRTDGLFWTRDAQCSVTGRFGYAEQVPQGVLEAVAMLALVNTQGVASALSAGLSGIGKVTVLNVTVDTTNAKGTDTLRQRALADLDRYRRAQ